MILKRWENDYPKEYEAENYWARLARLRNDVVDDVKQNELDYDFFLWIDADIDFTPTLLDELLAVDAGHPGMRITSPLVLIEGTEQNYDTAGMREVPENRSGAEYPYFAQTGNIVNLCSTGCVALVPAWVHHSLRFTAMDDLDLRDLTEWYQLCALALRNWPEFRVVLDRTIVCRHAALPQYGENYH